LCEPSRACKISWHQPIFVAQLESSLPSLPLPRLPSLFLVHHHQHPTTFLVPWPSSSRRRCTK
jgi:hypothetical protein